MDNDRNRSVTGLAAHEQHFRMNCLHLSPLCRASADHSQTYVRGLASCRGALNQARSYSSSKSFNFTPSNVRQLSGPLADRPYTSCAAVDEVGKSRSACSVQKSVFVS
jgi:hypothetical protein